MTDVPDPPSSPHPAVPDPPDEPAVLAILRAVATGRDHLPTSRLDEADIRWAIDVGLGGLLGDLSRGDVGEVRAECARLVQGAALTAKLWSARYRSAMIQILDAGRDLGGRLTAIKGISISHQCYERPYWRTMGDIDLLVDPDDASRVEGVLRDLGYRQQSTRPASFYAGHHHSMPFFHPETTAWVEVHTALFPPESRLGRYEAFRFPALGSHLLPSRLEGREVNRLSAELQLVYIAAHWAESLEVTQPRAASGVTGMLDTICLLRICGPRMDWDLVCSWLDDRGIATPFFVLTDYLQSHGLIELDEKVESTLRSAPRSVGGLGLKVLHRIIDRCWVGGLPFGRFLTRNHAHLAWRTLLRPSAPLLNLATLPYHLLLPPDHPRRFSPKFQLERLQSLRRHLDRQR